jgi:hypothetical protein
MSGAVQLVLDGGLPLDPEEVARLLAHERRALYLDLNLCPAQTAAIEEAVRLVLAKKYSGGRADA